MQYMYQLEPFLLQIRLSTTTRVLVKILHEDPGQLATTIPQNTEQFGPGCDTRGSLELKLPGTRYERQGSTSYPWFRS